MHLQLIFTYFAKHFEKFIHVRTGNRSKQAICRTFFSQADVACQVDFRRNQFQYTIVFRVELRTTKYHLSHDFLPCVAIAHPKSFLSKFSYSLYWILTWGYTLNSCPLLLLICFTHITLHSTWCPFACKFQ